MRDVVIDGNHLNIEDAVALSKGLARAKISDKSMKAMSASRQAIEKIIQSDEVVYGINTGFGAMSSVRISGSDLDDLQTNLIRSHACGIGENMDPEHVLLMMVFRANSLAKGVSGIRPEVVEMLIDMLNFGIAPLVPRIGSLGASGDLAPLSHMSLAIMGEGECMVRSESGWKTMSAKSALTQFELSPIQLQAKEGLSLINGTSQMCAYLSLTLLYMEKLLMAADASAACSVEAIKGSHAPFDNRIHQSRPQRGQSISAARIAQFVSNSQIHESHTDCDRVQDAYCFRCAPQVHGPVIDLISETRRMLEIEINSATDNPLVFVNDESFDVISGGNFHGQNLALASDSIAIACHELASISERRINQVLDPNWSGQKAFLAQSEGLESGFMIIQYVAAACIAEMHLLANSTTICNIPVSMGKEDHVSMGATGTYRSLKSCQLLSQVLANELICSAEALDRIPESSGAGVTKIIRWVRTHVDSFNGDRVMSSECESLSFDLLNGGLQSIFE
ncbi:MAG: histidine ammonia-lyase [Candidatus Thermoplasmatota archaeon]|nr:histidine ammonia-lyase [Candidatus Thermoplasmatota archaeon]